jgi:copper(I)-binding protein
VSNLKTALIALLLCATTGAAAQAISVDHPYARATPPGARTGGAFFVLVNGTAGVDRLVAASSPAARAVELHQMAMDGGVMKMRAIPAIDIPAGGRVELKPGGYHVMLVDLKQPLKAGDRVPMTLTFERAGTLDIVVPVEAMAAAMPHMQ